jgi:DNA-binding XRE family transcriptional regulator
MGVAVANSENNKPFGIRMRRVFLELARMRRAAEITQSDAAKALSVVPSTVHRIEKSQRMLKRDDLLSLLMYYKASRQMREALVALYDKADEPGLLTREDLKLTDDLADWICFEQTASKICNYEQLLVPGLIQTIPYAIAVISSYGVQLTEQEVSDRVAARIARQALLRRPDSPQFSVILHEAALLQDVGGTEAMRGQLEYLAEIAHKPNIDIRVIPMRAGAHPGLGDGPFVVMDYADLPSLVHIEHKVASVYLESLADIEAYKLAWDRLREVALPPATSVRRIEEIARGLG